MNSIPNDVAGCIMRWYRQAVKEVKLEEEAGTPSERKLRRAIAVTYALCAQELEALYEEKKTPDSHGERDLELSGVPIDVRTGVVRAENPIHHPGNSE